MDAQRTGCFPAAGPQKKPAMVWSAALSQRDPSSTRPAAALAGGRLFTSSSSSEMDLTEQVVVLDAASGKISHRWLALPYGSRLTFPAAAGGLLFISVDTSRSRSTDCEIAGVDLNSGRERWVTKLPKVTRTPPLVHAGLLIFGDNDKSLYGLDPQTGKIIWRTRLAGALYYSTAAAHEGLILADAGRVLHAVEPRKGKVAWTFDHEDTGSIGPSIDPVTRLAFCADYAKCVYAVELESGVERWRAELPEYVDSPMVIAEGQVFCSDRYGNVTAFDAATGQQRWRHEGRDGFLNIGGLSTAGGVLYFVQDDPQATESKALLRAHDTKTGKALWTLGSGDLPKMEYDSPTWFTYSAPVVTDGLLIVAYSHGLAAFR